MATLRVYRGDQFVAPFELGEGRTRIGRGTDNHLVLEDHDKQVSRSHAEIWHERGRYVIADLNSQNGVWIGERQIKTEEPLPENVPVTIGPYRLILMPEEKPAALSTDELDVTGRREAYVEPTQLLEAAGTVPPAPAARSHAPKIPTAEVPAKPKTKLVPLLALGALGAAALLALVIFMSGSKTGEKPSAGNNPTPPPPESTTTIPPNKTPEEIFQEHFAQAQAHLEAQNPAAAKEENRLALGALPDDPRGLAQQQGIEGILNPPPPVATPTGTKPPVGPVAKADGDKAARDKMEEGRRAVDERRFGDAIVLLEEAGRLAGPGNSPAELNDLLARAKSGRAEETKRQQQATAQKALDEARASVGSDVIHASQKLREARAAFPDLPGIADVEAAVRQQAQKEGADAFALAKNFDNAGRTIDAIRNYERTMALFDLVPGEQDKIAFSKQRIQQLKQGK